MNDMLTVNRSGRSKLMRAGRQGDLYKIVRLVAVEIELHFLPRSCFLFVKVEIDYVMMRSEGSSCSTDYLSTYQSVLNV